MIHLRRGLVVPRTPRRAAVDGDGRALIARKRDDPRIARVDPDRVIVVAARRPFDRDERLAAVGRAVRRRVREVDGLRIARIDRERDEVVAALRDLIGIVDAREVRARIVAAIERARVFALGFDVGVRIDDSASCSARRRLRRAPCAPAVRRPTASTSCRRRST